MRTFTVRSEKSKRLKHIPFEKVAQMIEREGRLVKSCFIVEDTLSEEYGWRCAMGVIENWKIVQNTLRSIAIDTPCSTWSGRDEAHLFGDAMRENDSFHGTPEERAVFMATKFREWDQEDEVEE